MSQVCGPIGTRSVAREDAQQDGLRYLPLPLDPALILGAQPAASTFFFTQSSSQVTDRGLHAAAVERLDAQLAKLRAAISRQRLASRSVFAR